MSIKKLLHHLNRRDTVLIPKIPKKFKFVLILVLIVAATFFAKANFAETSKPVFTDDYASKNPLQQKQAAMQKGNNQESWINESLGSNATAGVMAVGGTVPDKVFKGDVTGWIPGGMIGTTNRLISFTFNQPVSGVSYIAQTGREFLGKPAYAQGIGFPGLQPILPIWKTFRNFIYLISSLVFIGMGISIMLRIKISPQAVVTIQNSIPRIITTLILVTFSYAIAGLVIDLSYVIQGVVIAALFQGSGVKLSDNLFYAPNADLATTLSNVIIDFPGNLWEIIYPSNFASMNNGFQMFKFLNMVNYLLPITMQLTLGFMLSFVLGIALGPIGAIVGGLATLLFPLIIGIATVVFLIKFFLGLIKCYFNIFIKIILAPLEIALGVIPNIKMGFGKWLKELVANVAVFPVSMIFLVIVNLIIHQISAVSLIWAPPLLSLSNESLSIFIRAVIGFGALMMLPKLPKLIVESTFKIEPSPYGKAIGESAGSIAKPVGGLAKKGASAGIGAGANFLDKQYQSGNRDDGPVRAHNTANHIRNIFNIRH